MFRGAQTGLVLLAVSAGARAQMTGSVPANSAVVTTAGQVVQASSARIVLTGDSGIVAKDRTAAIALARGGTLLLCRTSSLHLAGSSDTLAIGLDRGAFEIRTKATATDAILTPDLRLTVPAGGTLDLRMRVSPDGDTCVENRGKKAPVLMLNDAFGEASYQLRPGQHVLFERGSLKAVVDRETTPCGCPPEDPVAVPLAEAILHGNGALVTPQQAAAANPFPTAQSEGLAPPAPLPASKTGETQTQISMTIASDPTAHDGASAAQAPAPSSAPAAPVEKTGPLRAVGRFFKRLFVR